MTAESRAQPIVHERQIAASPETVFAFFTDPDKVTRWLGSEATLDPREGGVWRLTQSGRDGEPYLLRGEFVEVTFPTRVVFTWGFENEAMNVRPGQSTVEVSLEPRDGGTWLRLEHRDLPESEVAPHDAGWAACLDSLAEGVTAMTESGAMPAIVDRATWQAEVDALRVREKEHTRAGDAIAAARRRLPMVEVDATLTLVGPSGPVTLLETFEGRRQLIAYFHMWFGGEPAAAQCEGCTFFNGQVRELSYLHSRDVTYATFCQGPYEESVRYRDFMGWDVPWYSAQDCADALMAGRGPFMLACYLRHDDRVFETYWTTGRGVEVMAPTHGLLDMTVYGRQEVWEDSPAGWPRRWQQRTRDVWRTVGRPSAQWSRLRAGRSDDLALR